MNLKRKKQTKFLSLVLTIILLIGIVPAAVFATDQSTASGNCGAVGNENNVTWEYFANTYTLRIDGTGAMADYEWHKDENSGNWIYGTPWEHFESVIKIVEIADGVTYVGQEAFDGILYLEEVTIGSGVTAMGNKPINYGWNLPSINVADTNNAYTSENGTLYNKDKTTLIRCNSKDITSFTIPNSVTKIEKDAFRVCSNLTSVTIPEGVESIGNCAFFQANGLESVVIPDSVKTIGVSAFYFCPALTEVTIGTGIISIGVFAFSNCIKLTTFTINASTPPELGYKALHTSVENYQNTINPNLEIYTPAGTREAYQTAKGWTEYADNVKTPHVHNYNPVWTADENNHWHECICGDIKDSAAHTPNEDDGDCTTAIHCSVCGAITTEAENHTGGTATCTQKAICTNCGKEYGEFVPHNYNPVWTVDKNNHWHECICGDIKDSVAHTESDWIIDKAATTSQTGTKHTECSVCKKIIRTSEIEMLPTYTITDGDNSSYEIESNKPFTVTADGDFSKFTGVKINGILIDSSDYTAVSGSTVITLKSDVLDKLSAGNHTISIIYTDGEVSAQFSVIKNQAPTNSDTDNPQTGDYSSMIMWTALIFVSVSGILTLSFRRRKSVK